MCGIKRNAYKGTRHYIYGENVKNKIKPIDNSKGSYVTGNPTFDKNGKLDYSNTGKPKSIWDGLF